LTHGRREPLGAHFERGPHRSLLCRCGLRACSGPSMTAHSSGSPSQGRRVGSLRNLPAAAQARPSVSCEAWCVFPRLKEVIPMFSRKLARSAAVGAAVIAIGGGAYGIVSATASNGSGTATTAATTSARFAPRVPSSPGSNPRSGPAAGGSSGTVDSVSKSSFTISTSAGQR